MTVGRRGAPRKTVVNNFGEEVSFIWSVGDLLRLSTVRASNAER